MSDVSVATYDSWLTGRDMPAALTARQTLQPVEGSDAIIFPPTFAAESEGQKGDYCIQFFEGEFSADITSQHPGEHRFETHLKHVKASNVCLIDTVGAEANRVEPLFRKKPYAALVPQIVIKMGEREVNLLDAGHRAGDALVRFSAIGEGLWDGFQEFLRDGNAEKIAKIAPTSLVFGVWDSRGTQAKVPRAFRSVVRAYNVRPIKRSAQYNPAVDYKEQGMVKEELDKGKGDENPLSREGFKHNPAVNTPGGVIVDGEIRRDMIINLSAIRLLRASDDAKTLALQRYILGLALVAATAQNEERFNLREGCLLRVHPQSSTAWKLVPFEGKDVEVKELDGGTALKYATEAAAGFGVGESQGVQFNADIANKWLALPKKEQDKVRRLNPMTKQFTETSEEVNHEAGEGDKRPKKVSGKKAK